MAINTILLFLCLGVCLVHGSVSIPVSLRECYANGSELSPPLPLSLRILVDIIRKVERYSYTTTDIKTLSSSLLHRFKFDGIAYHDGVPANNGILPFSGTGSQRTKNRLIEELVPGNADLFPSEVLTKEERCTLHRALSNTIMRYGGSDADRPCTRVDNADRISGRTAVTGQWDCPQEHGVIHTPYGTIALGVVIETIAASLQRQNIAINQLLAATDPSSGFTDIQDFQYNEEEVDLVVPRNEMAEGRSMWHHSLMTSSTKLDSVWLTSVAGELAEMVVYQGPLVGQDMELGASGFWNSTMRPAIYYLSGRNDHFDATRAELLGGIDGLIIASNLQTWLQDFYSLRLSQILDMYYSYAGVAFNSNIKACERARNYPHAVPRTILGEQTFAVSQLLAYRKSIAYMTAEALQRMVGYAVDKFSKYAEQRVFVDLPCRGQSNKPRVEALIAFDGSWSIEYTVDFMSVLIQDMDVSMYGSKMGIIHGTSGEWLLNVTNSPATAFHTISNFTEVPWPSQFNYIRTLESVYAYLNNTWEENYEKRIIGGLGQVVVLLIPLAYMSNAEKEDALLLLKEMKQHHPDVHFVYYTSRYNANLFKSFVISEEDFMIKNSNIDAITQYLATVHRTLRPIVDRRFNVTEISAPETEGYISPSEIITYRLHPYWRQNSKKILLRIHTFGYGTMNLCTWNLFYPDGPRENLYCRELTGHKDVDLTDHYRCTEDNICPSTYYQLQNATSLYKCAEIECKTPDQVRFIVRRQQVSYSSAIRTHCVLSSISFVLLLIFQTAFSRIML